MRRRTFAVGRVDRKTTEVRVVEHRDTGPCPERPGSVSGPFRVAAVVRATGSAAPVGGSAALRVDG